MIQSSRLLITCLLGALSILGAIKSGAQAPSGPENGKSWVYRQATNQMTGQVTKLACIDSSDQLQFGPPYDGGTIGRICLAIPVRSGKRQYGSYVFFQINTGQISCTVDGCEARFKIDDEKPFDILGAESADGDPKFINFPDVDQNSPMWKSIKRAKEIRIEVLYYQEGRRVLTFTPSQPLDPQW